MHFDQRTQTALREFGLDTEEIAELSRSVADAAAADARDIERFFSGLDVVHSDMTLAHSSAEFPEHRLEYVDLYTHGADLRGYVAFDGWGVPVEGGRLLSDSIVELTLGPTVHDRVRFAADRDEL
ncbi:MAG: hypothetical protein RI560_10140 [Natronomonas sp.]|jgi:hypothetical protein|uniref:Uncharacterized protein n=1 Tax=Natronomonas salsuginis TaxID=2217661 RepID=A0A4U5JDD1_9EURY|nr:MULTISPECIES: hypothetical protein [Natronomonas]MDR9382011.1 hypothetical protein [Natronomonas sp.]MDR9431027.1 hypothetical protein [Natronomonas sp.]TKR25627.1 hypothetical protein DM868_09445 [Natronomonas salsuginis]